MTLLRQVELQKSEAQELIQKARQEALKLEKEAKDHQKEAELLREVMKKKILRFFVASLFFFSRSSLKMRFHCAIKNRDM